MSKKLFPRTWTQVNPLHCKLQKNREWLLMTGHRNLPMPYPKIQLQTPMMYHLATLHNVTDDREMDYRVNQQHD